MKKGISIGSRKWGGFTEDSDYDIACLDSDWKEWKAKNRDQIKNLNSREQYSGQSKLRNVYSHKFTMAGSPRVYNIITYASESDLDKLRDLNDFIDAIHGTKIHDMFCNDKKIRCMLIETLFDILWFETEEEEDDFDLF